MAAASSAVAPQRNVAVPSQLPFAPPVQESPILPVVFGAPERAIVGFFHPPADGAARRAPVVLVSPLGHEAMCVHRTYRALAQHLATRGFPALRFDLPGTGDSAQDAAAPTSVTGWVDGVRAAIDEVRVRAGDGPVTLFGLRFGAALAALAAAGDGRVGDLVLWAPALPGKTYVRDLRAARLLERSKIPVPKRADGGEEIMGYLFSRELLAEMSAVEVPAATRVRRALVVPRNDSGAAPEETRLVEAFRRGGVDARVAAGSGYAAMMRDPYRSEVPDATLEAIVAWLGSGDDGPRTATIRATPEPRTVAVASSRVVETPLVFGRGDRLFGVVTDPAGGGGADVPVVLLLNVGADRHVGPHNMTVGMARRLGELGYPSLRFDASGLGDSNTMPGGRENVIYTMDQVTDLVEAMDALEAQGRPRRFVLVGVCSGAYQAYHTATRDPRVVGQVLINSFAFEWKEGDPVEPTERTSFPSSRFYARALLDRSVWRRVLRGEVNVPGIAHVLLERATERVQASLRSLQSRLRGEQGENHVERAFLSLGARGVQSLMVFSFVDGGLDTIARYLGPDASRMQGKKGFAIEIVDGVDHTFRSLGSQERLVGILTQYMRAHFPPRG